MDKIILDVKNGIELELNEAKIMYSMTNYDRYKDSVIIHTVLQKWFNDINNIDEFNEKLDAFSRICNMKDLIDLFFQIMRIENLKRDIIAKALISNGVYVIDKTPKYDSIVKMVENVLLSEKKYPNIDYLLDEYIKIVNSLEYINLSKKAGWSLSSDFAERENYVNSVLFKKVEFFNSFKSKLFIISNQFGASVSDVQGEITKEETERNGYGNYY